MNVLQQMITLIREHFDYCWPGDATVVAVEANSNRILITFDRFTMSLDDPGNDSREDLTLGESSCCFHAVSKVEFRLWPDDRNYRLDPDISKLVGCTLEESGDMPSDEGHYFEITGFCDAEWFEFRIYSNNYDLTLLDADHNRMKTKAEPAAADNGDKSPRLS